MKKLFILLMAFMFVLVLSAQKTEPKPPVKTPAKPKPLVTFLELGSVSCIPCKLMKPVMAEIEKEYGDKVSVVFYDLGKQREMSSKYKVRVMPTQVFLDKKGREFYRHEGFFPKEDIIKLLDKQLGIKRPPITDVNK